MRTEKIIKGVLESDRKVLGYVYKKNFRMIESFVVANLGTTEDAWDIFQEAMIILLQKLRENPEVIHSSFSGYLYGIGKYIWFSRMRQMYNEDGLGVEWDEDFLAKHEYVQIVNEIEVVASREERERVFQEAYLSLKTDCRRIIEMIINGCDIKEIAEFMNYASIKYAFRKRQQCRERLLETIKSELITKYQKQ